MAAVGYLASLCLGKAKDNTAGEDECTMLGLSFDSNRDSGKQRALETPEGQASARLSRRHRRSS
jgi:hypothetical protein